MEAGFRLVFALRRSESKAAALRERLGEDEALGAVKPLVVIWQTRKLFAAFAERFKPNMRACTSSSTTPRCVCQSVRSLRAALN